MILKFLICGTLICFVAADVKFLNRMYLPPANQVAIEKSPDAGAQVENEVNRMYLPPVAKIAIEKADDDIKTETVEVENDVSQNELVDNNIELDSLEPFTKDAAHDPAYGNGAFGFNGLPGGFPGAFPSQGFPGQGPFPGGAFPGQGLPPQGFPGQGFPGQGFPPSQGFINPGFPSQGFPGQGPFPGQGFPGQGPFPGQGFPGQGFPGQGFSGQGFPGQGFPGQGFPLQRFPPPQNFPSSSQNFVNPGFQGQGFNNYPLYSSEQLKMEEKPEAQDEKLRLLVIKSDTQYDATNGGYLYNKPTVTF